MSLTDARAFIGNHRKVSLLKNNKLLVLETQKKYASYAYDREQNELYPMKNDSTLVKETVAYYQSAFELFKTGELKLKTAKK